MPNIMNINEEDIGSFEKCRGYTVSVVECGKIGIRYACLFADAGFKVVGVNTNPHVLMSLKKGRAPVLKEARRTLEKQLKDGSFTASSDPRKAASESDVIVVAAQTPVDEREKPDYSALEKSCREVGMGLKGGSLVLFITATGPGVIEGSIVEILEKTSGLTAGRDFGVAASPDRASLQKLKEVSGSFRVVGAIDESSLKASSLILSRITNSEIVRVSSIGTAEAANLLRNVQLETNLAIANELASLCERLGIDFLEVLKVSSKEANLSLPSPGILNGSVRRDYYLLREEAENVDFNLRLPLLAKKINDEIADHTFRLAKDALKVCGKTVRRARVSVLGVSRRPDVKEPPGTLTKHVVNHLKKKVRAVLVYDPFFSKKELVDMGFAAEKLWKAVEKTDCVIVLVGHSKFKRLSLKKIKLLAKKMPAIVDIGNVVDPARAEKHGFVYRGLGRGVWTK